MSYQLLALDLDGTVLASDLTILPEVRQAIREAQARGVHVTLATGRMFGATLPYVEELQINDPVICYQGALVRHPHTGEVYAHVGMPGALAGHPLGVHLVLEQEEPIVEFLQLTAVCRFDLRHVLEPALETSDLVPRRGGAALR